MIKRFAELELHYPAEHKQPHSSTVTKCIRSGERR
jgi:hypothetical protein